MTRPFCRLGLVHLFAVSAFGIQANRPVALCPVVDEAPVIDGKLDDAVWVEAEVYGEFTDTTGKIAARPATRFRICTDGKWLYLGIELSDPDTESLNLKTRGPDEIRFDETAELFFAPYVDRAGYYHFATDPANTGYDNFGTAVARDHNFSWEHKTRITSSGWVCETKLPLHEMERPEGVRTGDMFHMNICRSTRGAVKEQCWSATEGNYHERSKFGLVIVGSYRSAAKGRAEQLVRKVEALKQRVLETGTDAWKAGDMASLEKAARTLPVTAETLVDGNGWADFEDKIEEFSMVLWRLETQGTGLIVWPVNPWNLPDEDYLPGADDKIGNVCNRTALQGEYVTLGFGLCNGTDRALRLQCTSPDIVSGRRTRKAGKDHITLRRVDTIRLRNGSLKRDALPVLRIEDVITILPQQNGILWVTVDTHGLDPGIWQAGIEILPRVHREYETRIYLSIRVLPSELPQGPEPYSLTCGQYSFLQGNATLEQALEDQDAHFTNVHMMWMGNQLYEGISFDPEGRIGGSLTFDFFDTLIKTMGVRDQLIVVRNPYPLIKQRMELGAIRQSGNFDRMLRENTRWCVSKVRDYFQGQGVTTDNYAWYGADEASYEQGLEAVELGRILEDIDPGEQLLATLNTSMEDRTVNVMLPYIDIWVQHVAIPRARRELTRKHAKQVFSYNIFTVNTNPYWGYRLEAMRERKLGCDGLGFFAYDAAYNRFVTLWDDRTFQETDCAAYIVVYGGSEGLVPSVRWEAWRQGIQDWRYLLWLEALCKTAGTTPLTQQAGTLLGEIPERILSSGSVEMADRVVDEVRWMGMELLTATGAITPRQAREARNVRPVCLTGNEPRLFVNIDTKGSYTYSTFPAGEFAERCGVKEGTVYFNGVDAPDGPQKISGMDGSLTDGSWIYPKGWIINGDPPKDWRITFDFKKVYALGFALLQMDMNPWLLKSESIAVSVSETGKEGSWREVDRVGIRPGTTRLTWEDSIAFDLSGNAGRFVRFTIDTGTSRCAVGEIRIFGGPIESEPISRGR